MGFFNGLLIDPCLSQEGAQVHSNVPENVHQGELVSYPGPWSFQLGRSAIILVSDQELRPWRTLTGFST